MPFLAESRAALAEYFDRHPLRLAAKQAPNRHKYAELAFQLAYSGLPDRPKKTLWDYTFIEVRLAGRMLKRSFSRRAIDDWRIPTISAS